MSETTGDLAARLGVQDARYRHDVRHRCDACKKSVAQVVLVTGKVQIRNERNRKGALFRSRQVCHFCLPGETPWPGGVVRLDVVKTDEEKG